MKKLKQREHKLLEKQNEKLELLRGQMQRQQERERQVQSFIVSREADIDISFDDSHLQK